MPKRSTILPIISWLILADTRLKSRILVKLAFTAMETTPANTTAVSVSGTEIAKRIDTYTAISSRDGQLLDHGQDRLTRRGGLADDDAYQVARPNGGRRTRGPRTRPCPASALSFCSAIRPETTAEYQVL